MSTWTGRLLAVDLEKRKARAEDIPSSLLEDYLGGRGLGAKLLVERSKHLLAPLAPESPIIIAPGPLTGTKAPGAGRLSLTAISPLTNTVFDSNSGGRFGIRLKACGFDALVVEGRAASPTVLVLTPEGVRFDDAADLVGLGNTLTREKLADTHGQKAATLTIGPAGEAGSLLSNVCHSGRFFGRGGLGALFGAKNLKAIVASGDYAAEPEDPEHFSFIVDEARKLIAAHPITSKGLKQFGTAVMMNLINSVNVLPVGNFRENSWTGAARISGEALRDSILTGTHACPGCPIGCGRVVTLDGEKSEGPEFETLWAFGAALKCDDLNLIARLNVLANDLGLDTVSTGSTIAAARELFEEGALDFDPLAHGPSMLPELLTDLALRRGDAALLTDGSLALSKKCGSGEESMSVKGLEIPAYDPRGAFGQGLAYATSSRGGCHMRSYMVAPEILASPKLVDRFSSSGKAGLVIVSQNLNAATDSLVMCRFMSFALKDDYYARLARYATGVKLDAQGLMTIGERIYNLERLINNARGFTRADDRLPQRLTDSGVGAGPSAGRPVPLAAMLDEYYRFRGWDREGRPTPAKLKALSLTEL